MKEWILLKFEKDIHKIPLPAIAFAAYKYNYG